MFQNKNDKFSFFGWEIYIGQEKSITILNHLLLLSSKRKSHRPQV